MTRSARRRRRSLCGATTVETLIVFLPLITLFLIAVQFSHAATGDLMIKHATVAAARAAIVVLNPDANPGGNGPDSDVVNAAALALGPWLESGAFQDLDVVWTDTSTRKNPYGRITVTVTADFRCRVPIGRFIICGGTSRRMTFTAALPHQGAQYRI
jgi:Flp pilus assembly protein TadG